MSTNSSINNEKGLGFENEVAKWTKKFFEMPNIDTRKLLRLSNRKRPFELDIHLWKEFPRSWFISDGRIDIGIECKNMNSKIKFRHVDKFVSMAKQLEEDNKNNLNLEDFYFDYICLFSNTDFDSDALFFAEKEEVACFKFNNGSPILIKDLEWVYNDGKKITCDL